MTPRLWRLRQLIVSDLNTSTQTMFFVCFCDAFPVLSSVSIFGGGTFSHPWPFPQFWPVFDLPAIIHPWQANSTDDIAAVKTILNERCISQEKFTFQLHGILQNFRLLISSAVLANFVPPCSPFAQILQTSPSTFLLISLFFASTGDNAIFYKLRIMRGSPQAGD